jgi:hypothetical protein
MCRQHKQQQQMMPQYMVDCMHMAAHLACCSICLPNL